MAFGFGVGVQRLGSFGVDTQAALLALPAPGVGIRPTGFVYSDPDPAKNGVYTWTGAVWSRQRGLPDAFAAFINVAGTANAITATAQAGIDPAVMIAGVLVPIAANTGAATLNGAAIVDRSGNPLAVGALAAGVAALLFKSGTSWRLMTGNVGEISDISGLQASLNAKVDKSDTNYARLNVDQTWTQPQRFGDMVSNGNVYFNGAAYIANRPLGDSSPWLASTGFVQQELNSHFTDVSNFFRYQKTAAGASVTILSKNLSTANDSQAVVQWETGRSNVYGFQYLKNDGASGGFMGLVGGPNVKQMNFTFDAVNFYNNAGTSIANINGSGMGLKAGSLYYIGGVPLGYGAGLQGFGDAATKAASFFATAAQGAKADTAVQPGDLGSAASRNIATAAEFSAGAASKALGAAEVWSAAAPVALAYAATITPDFNKINHAVTLTGNATLGLPANMKVGQSGYISVYQDGTGSRTLAFTSAWKFQGGIVLSLSTAANSWDKIIYTVEDATSGSERIHASLIRNIK